MIKKIKGLYLFISSLVICLLTIPFAFAKSASHLVHPEIKPDKSLTTESDSLQWMPAMKSLYDSLHLGISGLSQQAFDYARKGFNLLIAEGKLVNDSILSIIDFSQPSSQKRLYILDLRNHKILFNTLVAHGKNTGREWATQFSNEPSSYKSSTGFYMTGTTYEGKNGLSLKLSGLEPGLNDRAFDRGIVIHGANYVCDAYVQSQGYIGRSEGCPAVPRQVAEPVINTIRNGSCLYIYHPSQADRSRLLH